MSITVPDKCQKPFQLCGVDINSLFQDRNLIPCSVKLYPQREKIGYYKSVPHYKRIQKHIVHVRN